MKKFDNDVVHTASFELVGDHIKNAIFNAAYRACGEKRVLIELDLREAVTAECAKWGLLI